MAHQRPGDFEVVGGETKLFPGSGSAWVFPRRDRIRAPKSSRLQPPTGQAPIRGAPDHYSVSVRRVGTAVPECSDRRCRRCASSPWHSSALARLDSESDHAVERPGAHSAGRATMARAASRESTRGPVGSQPARAYATPPAGNQSCNDGGIKNACSRSQSMKFWGIPVFKLNPPDRPTLCDSLTRKAQRRGRLLRVVMTPPHGPSTRAVTRGLRPRWA